MGDEIRYHFYVTNVRPRRCPRPDVIFQSNARCNQENVIKQLKNGVQAMRMPAGDLVANWAYMAIATLAFNIKAWLGPAPAAARRRRATLDDGFPPLHPRADPHTHTDQDRGPPAHVPDPQLHPLGPTDPWGLPTIATAPACVRRTYTQRDPSSDPDDDPRGERVCDAWLLTPERGLRGRQPTTIDHLGRPSTDAMLTPERLSPQALVLGLVRKTAHPPSQPRDPESPVEATRFGGSAPNRSPNHSRSGRRPASNSRSLRIRSAVSGWVREHRRFWKSPLGQK